MAAAGREFGIRTWLRVAVHCAALIVCLALASTAVAADPSGPARVRLAALLNSVPPQPHSRFAAQDNNGYPVGTIKIISRPGGSGHGYIGVYHISNANGTYFVRVGTSSDMLHWAYRATLARNASQPTITALSNGGFLVAFERYTPGFLGLTNGASNLELLFYASYYDLVDGHASQTFIAPRTLSLSFEGTPDIDSVTVGKPPSALLGLFQGSPMSNSTIQISFHYLNAKYVDRQASGTLVDFAKWTAVDLPALDAAFGKAFRGNIGGRDDLTFEGYPFTIIEAQTTRNKYGTWRVYLRDDTSGLLVRLSPRTPGGSISFGNPKVTLLTDPTGKPAVVVSLYVFGSHNGPGEAGPLIYYNAL